MPELAVAHRIRSWTSTSSFLKPRSHHERGFLLPRSVSGGWSAVPVAGFRATTASTHCGSTTADPELHVAVSRGALLLRPRLDLVGQPRLDGRGLQPALQPLRKLLHRPSAAWIGDARRREQNPEHRAHRDHGRCPTPTAGASRQRASSRSEASRGSPSPALAPPDPRD